MPQRAQLILVFGISGVGKSTLCRTLALSDERFLHFEASTLLREAHGMESEAMRVQSGPRIQQNQTVLKDRISAQRQANRDKVILLCAHSVIDNDNELVVVSPDTIADLNPSGMVVIENSAQQIIGNRENATPSRYRPIRSVKEIERYQALASLTVQTYAVSIGVPLSVLLHPTPELFGSVIQEMTCKI